MTSHSKGIKFDDHKLRFSLIPLEPLREVVKVLQIGSCKYLDNNWQRVPDARQRYIESIWRHTVDGYFKGEVQDPDEGTHHLAHCICCCLFIIWFDIKYKLFKPFNIDFKKITEKYAERKRKALENVQNN